MNKGQSLVEILVASGIFIVAVSAIVTLLIGGYLANRRAGENYQALFLAEEGLEAVRSIRDNSWNDLAAGQHGLAVVGGKWAFSGTDDATDGLTRSVFITTIDSSQKNVSLTVGPLTLATLLTNWQRDLGDWSDLNQAVSLDLPGSADAKEIALYQASSRTYAVLVRNNSSQAEFFAIDITNPAEPSISGSLNLTGSSRDVKIYGNYVLVVSSADTQELQIVDLTNPSSPRLAGNLDLAGNQDVRAVAVEGTTVFLGRNQGSQPEIYAVSLAAPQNPTILSTLQLAGNVSKLELNQAGDYLFAASSANNQEIVVISVSDPGHLSIVGSLDVPGSADGTALAAFSHYVILGRANGSVLAIDVSLPSALKVISGARYVGSPINDLAMGVGNLYLFVGTSSRNNEFWVINLEDLVQLPVLGWIDLTANNYLNGLIWDSSLNRVFGAGAKDDAELVIIQPAL